MYAAAATSRWHSAARTAAHEMLKWARAETSGRACTRRRTVTWNARERLVERVDVRVRGGGRDAEGARETLKELLKWARAERLPVERVDVRVRGGGRPPRDAEVGARERLPVGRGRRACTRRKGGHLARRENDCPWNECCTWAASGGHLEVLPRAEGRVDTTCECAALEVGTRRTRVLRTCAREVLKWLRLPVGR